MGRAYESREDGITATVAVTPKGENIISELHAAERIDIVGTHSVTECLEAQSTEEYDNIKLRNEVLCRLESEDIESVQRWYFSQFSLKRRIYTRLKSLATLLPTRVTTSLRRCVRRLK